MQAVPHVSTATGAFFWRCMIPDRQGLDRCGCLGSRLLLRMSVQVCYIAHYELQIQQVVTRCFK